MSGKHKRIVGGLLTALGAGLAFLSVRSFIRWLEQRGHDQERQLRIRHRMQGVTPSYQPVDQPDRTPAFSPIPATGDPLEAAAELAQDVTMTAPGAHAFTTGSVEELADALVEYLLSFNAMIMRLRERRSEAATPGGRSLKPEDRIRFQEILDRLEGRLADYEEADLSSDTVSARAYRLAVKVRDALAGQEYKDDDLFRINGEIKSEACRVLDDLRSVGGVSRENVDRALDAYECA